MWMRLFVCVWVCWLALWSFGGCEPTPSSEPSSEPVEQRQEVIADRAGERPPTELLADGGPDSPEPTLEPPSERMGDGGTTNEPVVTDTAEPAPELPPEPTPEPATEPTADAGEVVPETTPEVPLPRPGFGAISGSCGVLDDTEWKSSQPFFFRNAIDLGMMAFDQTKLTAGGQKIWKDGNLGGSSVHSEIFAFELLARCELAQLLKSEGEIKYKQTSGKKTDLLVEIDGRKVGVSVTRAFHFPPENPYTEKEASTLLTKKLGDIPLSAANAAAQDAWVRSMLFVLAYNKQYADMVEAAYKKLDAQTKASVLLIVTVTDGKDDYIY